MVFDAANWKNYKYIPPFALLYLFDAANGKHCFSLPHDVILIDEFYFFVLGMVKNSPYLWAVRCNKSGDSHALLAEAISLELLAKAKLISRCSLDPKNWKNHPFGIPLSSPTYADRERCQINDLIATDTGKKAVVLGLAYCETYCDQNEVKHWGIRLTEDGFADRAGFFIPDAVILVSRDFEMKTEHPIIAQELPKTPEQWRDQFLSEVFN